MGEPRKPIALHGIPSLGVDGGGPPRSVSQLCAHLSRSPYAIHLLTASNPGETIVPLDPDITLHTIEGDTRSFLGRLQTRGFTTPVEAIADQISIVHQHGIWLRSTHEMIRFAHKRKRKLVVAPRGMLEPWALHHRRWKKKLAWALFQHNDLALANAFHATALSEAESIRRLGFRQPIVVIPNGVDLEPPLVRSPKPAGALRTALFLSRINPKKGILMLLDAWKRVSPEGWRLVIAGNDDCNHLPEVERKIRDLSLGEVVELRGPLYCTDKKAAFIEADLFVLPSYSENFGIVVAEALGYSLPVLTTTGCPWKELQTERCGWWVDPKPDPMAAVLKEALFAPSDELVLMGRRGRQLVEERYQWPSIALRMCAFYDWLCGNADKPEFVV